MAALRILRNRVASIRTIQRVTSALRLVAAARMRRQQALADAARPYTVQLERILAHVLAQGGLEEHPLGAPRESVGRVLLLVMTSDRGLCGGLNASVCRHALGVLEEWQGRPVDLVVVGRKGADFFRRRGLELAASHLGLSQHPRFAAAAAIAGDALTRYRERRADRVLLVYPAFRSASQQAPVTRQLLPMAGTDAPAPPPADFILESPPGQLLEALLPRHLGSQVWRALLETGVSEQAARMVAMDGASKSAGDLIEELTRQINKERQTAITLELMDIVGGANAVTQQ